MKAQFFNQASRRTTHLRLALFTALALSSSWSAFQHIDERGSVSLASIQARTWSAANVCDTAPSTEPDESFEIARNGSCITVHLPQAVQWPPTGGGRTSQRNIRFTGNFTDDTAAKDFACQMIYAANNSGAQGLDQQFEHAVLTGSGERCLLVYLDGNVLAYHLPAGNLNEQTTATLNRICESETSIGGANSIVARPNSAAVGDGETEVFGIANPGDTGPACVAVHPSGQSVSYRYLGPGVNANSLITVGASCPSCARYRVGSTVGTFSEISSLISGRNCIFTETGEIDTYTCSTDAAISPITNLSASIGAIDDSCDEEDAEDRADCLREQEENAADLYAQAGCDSVTAANPTQYAQCTRLGRLERTARRQHTDAREDRREHLDEEYAALMEEDPFSREAARLRRRNRGLHGRYVRSQAAEYASTSYNPLMSQNPFGQQGQMDTCAMQGGYRVGELCMASPMGHNMFGIQRPGFGYGIPRPGFAGGFGAGRFGVPRPGGFSGFNSGYGLNTPIFGGQMHGMPGAGLIPRPGGFGGQMSVGYQPFVYNNYSGNGQQMPFSDPWVGAWGARQVSPQISNIPPPGYF